MLFSLNRHPDRQTETYRHLKHSHSSFSRVKLLLGVFHLVVFQRVFTLNEKQYYRRCVGGNEMGFHGAGGSHTAPAMSLIAGRDEGEEGELVEGSGQSPQ